MSNVDFAAVDSVVDSVDAFDALDVAPSDTDAVPVDFADDSVGSTSIRSCLDAPPFLPTLSHAPKDWNSKSAGPIVLYKGRERWKQSSLDE